MKLPKILNWQLLAVPVLLIAIGTMSNSAVLIANHGKFPVMLNEYQTALVHSQQPDQDDSGSAIPPELTQMIDGTHSIMGPNSHLKVLADVFPMGNGIWSIGDGFLELGEWLLNLSVVAWIVLAIRKFNEGVSA